VPNVSVGLDRVDDRAVVRGCELAGNGVLEVFMKVEALAKDYWRHGRVASIPLF
jgi:hypothetical protein